MMIKNVIFLLVVSTCFLQAQQDEKIFLVMAYVDNFERDTTGGRNVVPIQSEYPRVLFNIEADTLVAFDTINVMPDHNLNRIIQFSDKQFFYLEEKSMYEIDAPNYFSILDYSGDSIYIRRYNSDDDSSFLGYSGSLRLFELDGNIWINNQYQSKLRYRGMNREGDFKNIELKDYQKIYRSGTASPYQYQPSFLYQYPFIHLEKNRESYQLDDLYQKYKNDIGSKLKLTLGRHLKEYEQMPDIWLQIPKMFRDSTVEGVWVVINNDKYFVGGGESKLKSEYGFKRYYRWIFDKTTSSFDTLHLDSHLNYVFKNYKNWLYGTAMLKDEVYLQKYDLSVEKDKVLAFKENDRMTKGRYSSENGEAPFLLNKMDELILVYLPTKKRIIWHTGDVDSEILLIEKNRIYYRVYDEIRCVNLDLKKNEIDWKTEELLVKDESVVPYVHHVLFSSTKQPKMKIVRK